MTNNKKIIAFDVDGVLRDFIGGIYKTLKQKNKDVIWNKEADYKLSSSFPEYKEDYLRNLFLNQYKEEIFLNADIYDGAKEMVEWCVDKGFYIKIITAQPTLSLRDYTTRWLDKHDIFYNDLIFSHSKQVFDYDLIVDDSPAMIQKFKNANKNFVIMDRSWNKGISGNRVKSYKELKKFIINFFKIS